ncbi:tail fiber domain-containing protein [Microbacterium sp. LWO14-1.2]|uniref:tail fiber domain-containing protein n=1 Tax=Microbacterium sp. LWO14-1.2 TaxID=3135263 RepID=UPI00313999A1
MPLTPTPGADALAAGIALVPGTGFASDLDEYINRLADEVARRTMATLSVAKGGTGATTAAAARANLGVVLAALGSVEVGKVVSYDAAGRIPSNSPSGPADVATKGYVDAFWNAATLYLNNVVVQGQLYTPAATPVTAGYVAAYINNDGRVGKSPSARRFKKDISDHAYSVRDLLGIRLRTYRLRAAVFGEGWEDAPVEVGVIAEELIDAGLSEFVHFDANGEPETVHYERLALVAIGALQELATTVADLTARVEALEA